MLCTSFMVIDPVVLEMKIFTVFTIYGHGCIFGLVTKSFENVHRQLTNDFWPRSSNDLDLHISIGVEFEHIKEHNSYKKCTFSLFHSKSLWDKI